MRRALYIGRFQVFHHGHLDVLQHISGADDVDGTIQEYEITRDAETNTRQVLTRGQLVDMIAEAGREPVERDTLYNVIAA